MSLKPAQKPPCKRWKQRRQKEVMGTGCCCRQCSAGLTHQSALRELRHQCRGAATLCQTPYFIEHPRCLGVEEGQMRALRNLHQLYPQSFHRKLIRSSPQSLCGRGV
eukprot:726210-Amphidinium_carterae.2